MSAATPAPFRPYAALVGALAAVLALAIVPAMTGPAHAAAVAPTGLAGAATVTSPVTAKKALSTSVYEKRVRKHMNKTRAAHGLPALKGDTCAGRFATKWSAHLAATDEFFHQTLGPILTKCNATWAGENLAKGAVGPKRVVKLWMNSPGHRAILLSKNAKRVGVGAALTSNGVWVTTADFVKR